MKIRIIPAAWIVFMIGGRSLASAVSAEEPQKDVWLYALDCVGPADIKDTSLLEVFARETLALAYQVN